MFVKAILGRAVLALALLGAAPVFAQDVDIHITTSCPNPPAAAAVPAPATPSVAAGQDAVRNRNYALARANFRPLAEKGDPAAERALGHLMMLDCTGLQDKAGGAEWLQKAADAGDLPAQSLLAWAYMNGQGVAQDDSKAFALFRKAAAAGNPQAEADLGYLYMSGRGVARDGYQAMVWSVKAGEQGAPAALMNIADAYFHGKLLPQDTDKAAYYMFAAFQRAAPGQRGRFSDTATLISRQMSAEDLSREARRARRWSPGPGSLSDVLDDAASQRGKASGD